MGDRVQAFTVVLDRDVDSETARRIKAALGMIAGVARVTPIPAVISDHLARERVHREVAETLFDVLEAIRDGRPVTVTPKRGEG